MKAIGKNLVATGMLLTLGAAISPALAVPQLEISNDTSSFENVELTDGEIGIRVDYTHYSEVELDDDNLTYELLYQGEAQTTVTTFAWLFANVQLRDLDSDGVSELIVQNYSGGAHCCTNTAIHRWDGTQFTTVETGFLDGLGVSFADLDNNGQTELILADQSFLYKFGSYIESFPPEVILTYQAGTLVDTTYQYPDRIQAQAEAAKAAFLAVQAEHNLTSNAMLASYVALSSQIGQMETAWQFMLDNYDPDLDWGLTIYNTSGEVVGTHADFPTALRRFLIEQGYLDAAGQPQRANRV
ncbi:MAG: VCBS repeat-containing protein [Cyanobacteria bacterium J06632_22]